MTKAYNFAPINRTKILLSRKLVANASKGQFVGQKLTQPNKSLTQTDSTYATKFKVRRASKDTSSSITDHKPRHSYIDPASYRNSLKHNLCIEMLENGFHQSFAELFNLLEQQRRDREAAPIGTGPHLLPVIEEDGTKLDLMKHHLTAAESSRRLGDVESEYMSLRCLAQYFEQTGDTWLADHFHLRCLETSVVIKSDSRKKEGEAHCNVGLSLENRGDLVKAIDHMETFYKLARKHKWHTESGDGLHEISCEHLRRLYTKLAEAVHTEEDSSEAAINLLLKAYEMAKEGGHTYQEGMACYRLGNAYEAIQESQTAIKYHRLYLEKCKHFNNDDGIGLACEALARSYESLGDLENAISHLEQYVEVTEKDGMQSQLARACSAIGQMSNSLGDYERAVEYFGRCYKLCVELNDKGALHSSRVQYGIAKGHHFTSHFSQSVSDSVVTGIQGIVAWKDIREDLTEDEDNG